MITSFVERDAVRPLADKVVAAGRFVGLLGVVLVLLSIGGLKFTQVEIEGLKPIIEPTPWLAWMYPAFGEAGASYLLGVVELATVLLLILSPWSARAGIIGGAPRRADFLRHDDHHVRRADLGNSFRWLPLDQCAGPVPHQGRGAARSFAVGSW